MKDQGQRLPVLMVQSLCVCWRLAKAWLWWLKIIIKGRETTKYGNWRCTREATRIEVSIFVQPTTDTQSQVCVLRQFVGNSWSALLVHWWCPGRLVGQTRTDGCVSTKGEGENRSARDSHGTRRSSRMKGEEEGFFHMPLFFLRTNRVPCANSIRRISESALWAAGDGCPLSFRPPILGEFSNNLYLLDDSLFSRTRRRMSEKCALAGHWAQP